ncbi:MAG: folate family ECF transporter S component [Eubacteriales bacterium]
MKTYQKHLRTITLVGVMTALSVLLARFVPLVSTPTIRVTLGSVPTMLTGIVCGPLAGALCGAVSDVIGCILSGYPPYLPLTLSPVLVGILPGVLLRLLRKTPLGKRFLLPNVCIALLVTMFLTSVIWTPLCLHWMTGANVLALIGARVPFNLLQTAVEIVVIYLLLKTKVFERMRFHA